MIGLPPISFPGVSAKASLVAGEGWENTPAGSCN